MKDIDSILNNMRRQGVLQNAKGKGDAGEEAALLVVLECQRSTSGMVYHSFKYPYQSDRSGKTYLGNIKLIDGKYVEINEGRNGSVLNDEIDLLYVTPYRVFPIEVKSYHSNNIHVYNDWMDKSKTPVEKSAVVQAEKHARHLYHVLYDVLPDGRPEYIKPVVCFVDRCTLKDDRRDQSISYIPCCILNNLKKTLIENNTPLAYNLDLEGIKAKLAEVKIESQKEFV